MKKKITQIGEYTIPFQYNNIEKDMHIIVKGEEVKAKKSESIEEEAVA
jgi:hypothetical protein